MQLFLFLAFLFIFIPWVEIVLLLHVWETLGPAWTVLIVLGTGAGGAALAKHQGSQAWRSVRTAIASGRAPSRELFDGFCILCAGLLLVTPGLLTDCTGFALLVPPFRAVIRKGLAKRLVGGAVVMGGPGAFRNTAGTASPSPGTRQAGKGSEDVIDVEAEVVDDVDDRG